jgi:hypothetical protein
MSPDQADDSIPMMRPNEPIANRWMVKRNLTASFNLCGFSGATSGDFSPYAIG